MSEGFEDALPLELEVPVAKRWPPWGWMDVGLAFAIFIGATIVVAGVGLAVLPSTPFFAGLPPAEMVKQPLFFIPAQLLAYVLAFIFIRIFITLRAEEDFWVALHWNMPNAAGITGNLVAGVVLAFAIVLFQTLIPMPKSLPIEQHFKDVVSATLMAVFAVLVAPLAEEIFFRGLLLPVAAKNLTRPIGAVFVSVAFALVHAAQLASALGPVFILFLVGLALSVRRLSTNSLAASWLMHVGYNSTLFAIMLWVTDGFRHLDKLK